MDAVSDPTISEIVVMKSAQIGWTEIINNAVGYVVHREPAPCMLMQPTLEMAESWSKDRFAPMVRDTPCLRERIADPRARDSGNTLLHKNFVGGHITVVGANSPAGLASRPIRFLYCDEVDRYPVSAGAEGDPISIARKRTTTFGNRKILLGSTPTVKGSSRIEAAFLESDQRYYFVPCPHCGEFQRLEWSQVSWQDGKPETAAYACKHCGVLLRDSDKPGMLQRGEWRPTKEWSGIAGFHLSELYSPWSTWPDMATAFSRAKKLPETLQTWVNTSLGETYEAAGNTVEPGSLLERRAPISSESIPAAVHLLTVGADTQDDRVELQLLGWGAEEESWILEQRVFRGDPSKRQLWLEVDQYLLQTFHREDGKRLLIEAACIDSGGHNTQAVYDFVVTRKRRRVWAIKGMAGPGRLAWPKKANRTTKSRANVFIVGVDTIKSLLYGRLGKVAQPGPGYIHLPQEADEAFCKQLTSEKSVTKYVRGRPVLAWEPREKGAAQEAQDCWVYGYAAFIGRRGPEVIRALMKRSGAKPPTAPPPAAAPEAPQEEQTDHQAEAQPAQQPPAPQPPSQQRKPQWAQPRRKNWVRSW